MIRRIVNLWQASVGSALSKVETERAEELLELERDELHRRLAEYNRGLAGYAALCERLRGQLRGLADEARTLEPKLRARLERLERCASESAVSDASDASERGVADRSVAGRYALRLEAIAREKTEIERQLNEAETSYRELVQARELAVSAAREKLQALKRAITECKTQTALAELTELASGMQGALGMSSGTLERLRERVEDKRDLAAGRVRVAREGAFSEEHALQETERRAEAEDALRRYEATRGRAERASANANAETPQPAG